MIKRLKNIWFLSGLNFDTQAGGFKNGHLTSLMVSTKSDKVVQEHAEIVDMRDDEQKLRDNFKI